MRYDDMIYAPFRGIVPEAEAAADVIAPPYDVLDAKEAKIKAAGKPNSFLHISKAEIDFSEDVSPYDDRVYQKAGENFRRMLDSGILKKIDKPCFYVYQMTMGTHTETGLAVAASVKAYNEGRIKRHELTRVAKENDRVRQIRTVGAQTGPALLINKPLTKVKILLQKITAERAPYLCAVGDNNVVHRLWIVSDEAEIAAIAEAFNAQNEAYIADGHHRSAAAARLAAEDHNSETARFLAVAFFADEMKIYDYNRVVFDLNNLSESEFLEKLGKNFKLVLQAEGKPRQKGHFGLYLNRRWYDMVYVGEALGEDPVSKLDVSILSAKVLDEILGIKDLRNSLRIDFIGGIRGAQEVERLTDAAPGRVGFMVYPTSVEELLAVADKKMLMPPKSTWFEPKLADGVISK